jgi:hypothetical protein
MAFVETTNDGRNLTSILQTYRATQNEKSKGAKMAPFGTNARRG